MTLFYTNCFNSMTVDGCNATFVRESQFCFAVNNLEINLEKMREEP